MTRMQSTRSCIDDALAVLDSSDDEHKGKNVALADELDSLSLRSDFPPAPPRRSFDIGLNPCRSFDIGLKHKQVKSGHDRFQLSKSEHVSSSLCLPSRPKRSIESGEKNLLRLQSDVLESNRTEEPPSLRKTVSNDGCSRDFSMRPRSRVPSQKSKRTSFLDHHNEHKLVTLRASSDRYLLGSRELSPGQHLRRSCPAREKDIEAIIQCLH
jgi:hypothetical protein